MINWQYISKGQYPKKDVPVICVQPVAAEDYPYALCVWSRESWWSWPQQACYSDFYDQWAYLPEEFYKTNQLCDCYKPNCYNDNKDRCFGTKEVEICNCKGNKKFCDFY